MDKGLALFDFDHTLYKGDSMLDYARFVAGNNRYLKGLVRLSPWLMLFKAGLLSNEQAKIRFLSHFFGGMPEAGLLARSKAFAAELDKKLDPKLYRQLRQHQINGDEVYVVSASCTLWLQHWCELHHVKLLASELEISNGKITGQLSGSNCRGQEKVRRIAKELDTAEYHRVHVYGKGAGDREMLRLHRLRK